jgi:hypothetical protein
VIPSLKVRLHENATKETLAAARILIFATWIIYVAVDPLTQLTRIPLDLFFGFGIFEFVPESVIAGVLTPTGVLGLKTLLIALFGWALFGFPGARWVGVAGVGLGFCYLALKKGFGGHFDHRELTLAYASVILLWTPAWDAWSVSRSVRKPRREGIYQASLIAVGLAVIVQYAFIGLARTFIGGPGVFMDGTLQNWIAHRNLRPNPFGFDIGRWFLDPAWSVPLDLLFLGGTALEVGALALLFLKPGWIKALFLVSFAVFHMSIFILMNVAFLENIVLLLLFVNLAAPVFWLKRKHSGAGTFYFDPGNIDVAHLTKGVTPSRAEEAGIRLVPHTPGSANDQLPSEAAEGVQKTGLAFVPSDKSARTASGAAAQVELLYRRSPAGLAGRWLQARKRGKAADAMPVIGRGPIAKWFLGPVG